ncbi:hypothetical protein [Edaphobacter dinghuensis]|uniref:Uncharacterized protein n=1 Tax=Edaphobacter dinghuensis TaxID=1560005 RepID=A0A917HAE2_9BACT|nr:hypothetical protein [Edaphobacter dinghuensis]GGG72643.1 hypothetical protein GCM10011585_13850 [Edaphobacter dinghuensis]
MIKLLRSYLFWTYERGSFHYDVMVTLILLFLFVGPRFIDFKAKPVETLTLDPSEVVVKEAGITEAGKIFVYQIRAQDLEGATTDSERQAAILNVIEPISGHVTLQRFEPIRDAKGKITAYNAWALR